MMSFISNTQIIIIEKQQMEISSTIISKLLSITIRLTHKSPLKKASKNELEAAIREIKNINSYTYKRECLNNVLVHLESAFSQFEPTTWNFLDDEDRVLWQQRTYKNDICITIAVIHYILGNISRARSWLTDELSEYGWVDLPEETQIILNIKNAEDFFKVLYDDDGDYYRQLEWTIKQHHEQTLDSSYYNPLDAEQNPYPY